MGADERADMGRWRRASGARLVRKALAKHRVGMVESLYSGIGCIAAL